MVRCETCHNGNIFLSHKWSIYLLRPLRTECSAKDFVPSFSCRTASLKTTVNDEVVANGKWVRVVKSAGSKEAQNIYLVLSAKEERFITFKP